MTCHYPGLGSASVIGWDFLSTNQKHYQDLGSDTSSVWNFCARYSDFVLRGLKWQPRETLAVFSGYLCAKFYVILLVHLHQICNISDRRCPIAGVWVSGFKDVRANYFCASLLRTQFTATSRIERARCWRNVEIYSTSRHFSIYARA